MSVENEFAEYLRQSGFERFVEAWISKYQSLGHLGGKIVIDDLSLKERESLQGLLGLDLSSLRLELTYHKMEKALSNTRFDNADFLEVLKQVKNETIYTKMELKNAYQATFSSFQESLLESFKETPAYHWLQYYFDNDKLVKKYYNDNQEYYLQILQFVGSALNQLPIYDEEYVLLPVFAQTITKNPHFFDEDLPRDLLCKGIRYLLKIENDTDPLNWAGLLKDDLSNYCYVCHIQPLENHLAWKGFYDNYEPWNMNLYNINQVTSIFQKSRIYVFENPSVFRSLSQHALEKQLDIGLISSNGQINYCTYLLFDKLTKSGCQLYYCGDFDPEGLLIADRLKKKYKENLILWQYSQENFDMIQVHQINISQKRLKMLENIEDETLQEIAQLIIEKHAFGYQEGLIEKYKSRMKE